MPLKMSKKKLYLIIAGIILVALSVFYYYRRNKTELPPKSTTVTRRTINETVELSGEVTAETYARLHFPVGGLVTYAPFSDGDQISKWATVASLDSREIQKTLTQKLNLYAKERNDFDTTQDTYEKEREDGDVDKELRRILEAAQYDLDNAVIDVEIRDLALKLSRLSSPLTGILVSAPITTSNLYVGPTDVWYIVDPSSLSFTADLDESDLSRVEVGQLATIELDAYPDMVLNSEVERISYSSKLTTTGTVFELNLHLPESAISTLRLGLNGNVSILRATHENVLTIPIESVKETGGTATVTMMEDGKEVERTVQLGASDDMYYEVVEGLGDGEEIYYGK